MTTADSSGTYHNTPALGQTGAIANHANKAIKFVGANQGHVEVPDSDGFSLARANDSFTRKVSLGSSWGTADHGGTWTAQVSPGTYYSCDGCVARINPNGRSGTWQQGLAVSRKHYELQVRAKWSKTASGGPLNPLMLVARMQDTNHYYRAQLNENADHTLDLVLVKVVAGTATTLATARNLGTYKANDWWYVRFRLDGTTLSARAWKRDTTQPTSWSVTANDSSITSAGTVALRSSNSESKARPVVSFDDFWVQSLGMTVHLWMKPDGLDFAGEDDEHHMHYVYLLGKGEGDQQEWAFRFYRKYKPDAESTCQHRSNRVSAYIWNATGTDDNPKNLGAGAYFQGNLQSPPDLLENHTWYQFAAVFDPGDALDTQAGVTLFKNGVYIQGPREPGNTGTLYKEYMIFPKNGTAPLRLGTRDLKSFFTGWLDKIAIFDRQLTDEEISDLYEAATSSRVSE